MYGRHSLWIDYCKKCVKLFEWNRNNRRLVMEQYISKSALVAEIKERIETYNKGYANGDDRRANALEVLLNDIDTLEVKEVDLEKELSYEDYMGFFNEHPDFPDDWGFDEAWIFAKHFFELGIKVARKGE